MKFLTIDQFDSQDRARALFDRFAKSNSVQIECQFDSWDKIWPDLVNTAVSRAGADISEVGFTLMRSLIEMNALRPFSSQDIALIGGAQAFLPSTWEAIRIANKAEIWGIPVRVEPRVIWYWKDMLEASGLDPQQAFSSYEQLPTTLSKLTKVQATPWAVGTSGFEGLAVHTLASWIWKAGGDFISEDGKRVLFAEPGAMRAMSDYFNLYRFMPQDANMGGDALAKLFAKRQVAAVIGGSSIYAGLAAEKTTSEWMAQVGVAALPGPTFIGGTALVIWQHSREYEKALKFLRYLVSPQTQFEYAPLIGYLPARQETWKMPPYSTDPIYQTYNLAIQRGRSMPAVPLWGAIQDRLAKTISQVWNELFMDKNPDAAQSVSKYFGAYAQRLSLTLNR